MDIRTFAIITTDANELVAEICSGDHWSVSFCATRHRSSAWRARRQGFGRNARSQAHVSASLAR
jgi:hypothetical protein